jgi:hypothetical protein
VGCCCVNSSFYVAPGIAKFWEAAAAATTGEGIGILGIWKRRRRVRKTNAKKNPQCHKTIEGC